MASAELLTVGEPQDPALGRPRGEETDWLLPTQALNRFRLRDGTSFDQPSAQKRQVRYGFRVGSLNLLITPRVVTEVIAMMPIAIIPNCPPWLLGMINLRSNLVPVFDLAMICGLNQQHAGRERWILVFDKGDGAVALVIDGQPEALRQMAAVSYLPSLPTALRGAVAGGFTVDQELWIEFDHQAFFRALNETAATTRA
jgi:twitching motility protein PilI